MYSYVIFYKNGVKSLSQQYIYYIKKSVRKPLF